MGGTRLGSQSEKADKCPKCMQKYGPKITNVIGCRGCNLWWHSDCAEIDTADGDIKTLAKYRTVHWFCDSCDLKQQQRGQDKSIPHVDSMINKVATQFQTNLRKNFSRCRNHHRIKAGCTQTPEYLIRRMLGSILSVAEKEPINSKVTKPLRNSDKIVLVTRTAN